MKFFKFIFLLVLGTSLGCNTTTKSVTQSAPKAKNLILLIGDGMGLAQISSIYYFGTEPSQFNRFNNIGLHINTPIGAKVTDSASGATAFSTGYKSYNGAIGVDGDTISRETIMEWAEKKGMANGIVSTSSVTHATPASFYAHVASRNFHQAIAKEFVNAGIDYTAGGGYKYFVDRNDGKNLLDDLKSQGVIVDNKLPENSAIDFTKRYTFLLQPDSMPSARYGQRGNFLPEATDQALHYLSKKENGFILMVEGSQIDWGGHANEDWYIVSEMRDFNKVLKVAMDFAEKDGNTLVVVTADHETGGYALSSARVFGQDDYRAIKPTFSTGGHTASLIPVFAYGPGSDAFRGVYQNNEIFYKLKKALSR